MSFLADKNRKLLLQQLKIAKEQVMLLEKNLESSSAELSKSSSGAIRRCQSVTPPDGSQVLLYQSGKLSGFDLAGIGLWEWDVAHGTVTASPVWSDYFGPVDPASATLPNPLMELLPYIHPFCRKTAAVRFSAFLDQASAYERFNVQKDKTGQWLDISITAIRSKNGTLQYVICTVNDNTEAKAIELSLRQQKDEMALSTVGFPDLSLTVDKDFCITAASPALLHYSGLSPELITHSTLASIFKGECLTTLLKALAEVMATDTPLEFHTVLDLTDSNRFAATIQLWPRLSSRHIGKSVNIAIWDMESPNDLMANVNTLFNNMVDGFIIIRHPSNVIQHHDHEIDGNELTIVAMNTALARLYNAESVFFAGKSLELLVGRDMEQWTICLQQVITHRKPVVYCMKSKEQSLLFELSAFVSGLDSIACIVKDVTSLQSVEENSFLNEARVSALYRFSYMYSSPVETMIHYALSQIIELTASESGGMLFYDMQTESYVLWSQYAGNVKIQKNIQLEKLKKEEKAYDFLSEHTASINNAVLEGKSLCSGYGNRILRHMVAPILEDGKLVCLARVANKRSDYEPADLRQLELFLNGAWMHLRRRWVQGKLEKAKEQAEAANQAKDIFLANVSHELRTPLNGILGMLQLLQQSCLSREQQVWVQVALDSGRGLLRIISDILNIARIEANKYQMLAAAFSLPSSLQSTLSIFHHKAQQKNIAFNVVIDERIPHVIIGDETLLRQIILNIVGNAFKFTNQGSIDFECKLLPYWRENAFYLYFAIHDTGIGIPGDQLLDIFKPFTQLDSSATRKYGGVGLGLSIVHRLVTVMGGALCVDSQVGKGTSFYISLPFKKGEERHLPAQPQISVATSHNPLSILVAEDDPVNKFTIDTMLKKMGHHVVCVENGLEALESLQTTVFDCLITDIQMPGMDGEELIAHIRRANISKASGDGNTNNGQSLKDRITMKNRQLPVVVLSAHAIPDFGQYLIRTGANFYLEKPINIQKLSVVLENITRMWHGNEAF